MSDEFWADVAAGTKHKATYFKRMVVCACGYHGFNESSRIKDRMAELKRMYRHHLIDTGRD